MTDGFTHVDESGAARMVDVSGKEVTARTATATGRVLVSDEVVAAAARPAGCPRVTRSRWPGSPASRPRSARPTWCRSAIRSPCTASTSTLQVDDDAVAISATVRTADRTGVEMEALTCVAVAGLALIDMVKAVDPSATITDVRVEAKTGGASGDWRRGGRVMKALVVTVSNRAAAGVYEDRSGPVLVTGPDRDGLRRRRTAGGPRR